MSLLEVPPVISHSRTRVLYGAGTLSRLGECAKAEGATHVLLVTDPGIEAAGHKDRAVSSLKAAGIHVTVFDGVRENPTTHHVEAGVRAAREGARNGSPGIGGSTKPLPAIDLIVGLGGGSSMDCAKGINFLHTNGGKMSDYWGIGKATRLMLPMIAIPTTAGTGSEAQSYALISNPITHQKMACGDVKAACRLAILDPDLTATQPPRVAAATGIDAIAHAVETAATTRRNEVSLEFTREAWARLDAAFERAIGEALGNPPVSLFGKGAGAAGAERMLGRQTDSSDERGRMGGADSGRNSESGKSARTEVRGSPGAAEARAMMLLGAHLAGAAIEQSMLGAAHACANPLTARCGITHGVAVGIMLPHVVRFNSKAGPNPYDAIEPDAERLARRIESFLEMSRLPRRLAECGVSEDLLPELAAEAAKQWTAGFNPIPVGPEELLAIYRSAG